MRRSPRIWRMLQAPVIVSQAIWVATRAMRLPEATGPRCGRSGHGKNIRLLVLGDSSAAGVGVARQNDALGGRLVHLLSENYNVEWRILAKTGATTGSTLRRLASIDDDVFDFVVIALGVNDAKNGVSCRRWERNYTAILDLLEGKAKATRICVSGLPPVRHFPLLPTPLSRVLGDRSDDFDLSLRAIAHSRSNVSHLPLDFTTDTTKMATDGFHPGAEIYDEWAVRAAGIFAKV